MIENKVCGLVKDVKELKREDGDYGLISGYIATFDVDLGNDKFEKTAFDKHLKELKKSGRKINFKDSHYRTVGIFPIDSVVVDDTGLFGVGEINLGVQQGKEAYLLAKQGAMIEFSIGYQVIKSHVDKKGIRVIAEAKIWEGSIVDDPMNLAAKVTEIKALEKKVTIDEIKSLGVREIEEHLKLFCTNSAAKHLANQLHVKNTHSVVDEVKKVFATQ